MKTKKLFILVMAIMLLLVALPIFASAEELITPEITAVPTATEIAKSGDRLRTSKLSGGIAIDPTTGEAIDGTFGWKSSGTKITESGYYNVYFNPSDADTYNLAYCLVFVRIAGDDTEVTLVTKVSEAPIVANTLTVGDDWSELIYTGGKAVDANGTEVDGVFSLTKSGTVKNAGNITCDFLFTPTDSKYATATVEVKVIVNAIPISFGPDHKGTSIDDPYIFEVAPFADMGEVRDILKNYHLNWPGSTGVQIEDYNGTAEHGRIYEYYVREYSNSNYTGNIAYVKLVFATTEITPSIVRAGSNKFKVDCAGHSVPGTFTIYHNDVEIATVSRKDGYVFDCEVYTDEGGTSHIKAVYNPVENDYYVCNDAEVTYVVPAMHSVTNARSADNSTYGISMKVLGSSSFTARAGQTVELRATLDSFVCWTFKDADGNEVTLEGVDLNAKQNTFIMPDYDLFVSYKIQEDLDREEAIANCDHLCHSDNALIRLFWNIINMFFRLLNVQQYCDCGELHYSAPLFPIA
ncbi:MAG: hypothetical protein IKB13_03960 [Clostridia bacterium]|nr:hypothetical protein [Clostridia bacterium]